MEERGEEAVPEMREKEAGGPDLVNLPTPPQRTERVIQWRGKFYAFAPGSPGLLYVYNEAGNRWDRMELLPQPTVNFQFVPDPPKFIAPNIMLEMIMPPDATPPDVTVTRAREKTRENVRRRPPRTI